MADDYEVGYGKPPKESQFSKGNSGNPAGRPKGSKSIATIFQEVTREPIHVTENGRQRSVTKLEAIILQLVTRAASGEISAIREIRTWNQIFGESADEEPVDIPDRQKNAKATQRIIDRILRRNTAQPTKNTEETKENINESNSKY